ncbi:MAG: hypothetical protein ABJA66_05670 [Actinomycetota bacterium]
MPKYIDEESKVQDKLPSSPYEIKRLAKRQDIDFSPIWENLKLDGGALEVLRDYQISVYPIDLNIGKSKAAIMLLQNFAGEACRFVLFEKKIKQKSNNSGWKVVSYVDVPNQRNAQPQNRLVKTAGKKWLVLDEQTGGGSGVSVTRKK